ncbi:hypothetical protein SBRCBS47491_008117 [Sporothrix bragantina]|uniref:Uncharacterized protein n=1 Tax=Sporothrix bragantina TaxID=671064 RepID=A0ABP0CLA3_9PEZI
MDALKGLIANVPDWIKRLDDLSSQIDERQRELARFVEPGATSSSSSATAAPSRTKSVRNKGSTESLKPQDEGAAWKDDEAAVAAEVAAELRGSPEGGQQSQQQSTTTAVTATATATSPTSPGAGELAKLALQKQTTQVADLAQARVRATLRKRTKRSDSIVSAEGVPKYRTRSMIIVYYDSYVQSFFEELVKFVSAQRNLMRKAKMAAKVAHIKRMAELEMPSIGGSGDAMEVEPPQIASPVAADPADKLVIDMDGPIAVGPKLEVDDTIPPATPATTIPPTASDAIEAGPGPTADSEGGLPQLNYRRTLNMRSPGMVAAGRPMYLRASAREKYMGFGAAAGGAKGMSITGNQQPPDVFDELDRGLEYVQSMCEHAAHQFLRDGDCNEEIGNIKQRLSKTKEQADREMERVKKEDPEALKALEEPPKTRSFRPQSMRRDAAAIAASTKEALLNSAAATPRSTGAGTIEADAALEVDEGIDDMDIEIPKLAFKSSRR